MEHSIKASEDGTVSEPLISVNDQLKMCLIDGG